MNKERTPAYVMTVEENMPQTPYDLRNRWADLDDALATTRQAVATINKLNRENFKRAKSFGNSAQLFTYRVSVKYRLGEFNPNSWQYSSKVFKMTGRRESVLRYHATRADIYIHRDYSYNPNTGRKVR